MTPVTKESFAKWKQTRMDKKLAEEDAQQKAKDTQAAAGKSSGMSGRDLVSADPDSPKRARANVGGWWHSSRTIPSGSKTKRTKRKNGTLRNTVNSKKTTTLLPKSREFTILLLTILPELLSKAKEGTERCHHICRCISALKAPGLII